MIQPILMYADETLIIKKKKKILRIVDRRILRTILQITKDNKQEWILK